MLLRCYFRKVHWLPCYEKGDQSRSLANQVCRDIQRPKCIKDIQKLTGRLAALNRFISKYSDKSHHFFNTFRKGKSFVWSSTCEDALTELKTYLALPPLLSKSLLSVRLLVYLSVFPNSLSVVLVRVEEQTTPGILCQQCSTPSKDILNLRS